VSLGEIVLVLIVGIIVVGPRNLPTLMRTAGQWVARLRRLTTELRSQSGIDDILRNEGLDEHIRELRSLSRANVMESLITPAVAARSVVAPATGSKAIERADTRPAWTPGQPLREREYPLVGCDSYNALPDDVMSYRTMGAASKSEEAEAKAEEAEAKAEDAEAKAEEADAKSEGAEADAGSEEAGAKSEGAEVKASSDATTQADEEKPAATTETATT
jgi:sec-independent protein translocase protein TatB